MKLKNFRLLTVVILGAIANINALAQIPAGYYDGLKGKKGAELKTAVHNIIKNAKVLDYGSGKVLRGGDSTPRTTTTDT